MGLVPGSLTPTLDDDLIHLGSEKSFERAARRLKRFRRVEVSEATARRRTEAAGAVYEAIQAAEVDRIEREMPASPEGGDKQFLSVDGAMVPLVGGEWAEVKTLVVGVVEEPIERRGERIVRTRELSYFSRSTDAETFGRLAAGETHRRGVETAGRVAAVTDGAEWEQGFIDLHRHDARRILDFPHAAERIAEIGRTVPIGVGAGGEEASTSEGWLSVRLNRLKQEGPASLLGELEALAAAHPTQETLAENYRYLKKREAHLEYPAFVEEGWPIGSGSVESGNKLVVEARLKGAGMHWARRNVNPLLTLRNALCSDRWDEAMAQIQIGQRRRARDRQRARRSARLAARSAAFELATVRPPEPSALALPADPDRFAPLSAPGAPRRAASLPASSTGRPPSATSSPASSSAPLGNLGTPRKPAPDHPWKRCPAVPPRPSPSLGAKS